MKASTPLLAENGSRPAIDPVRLKAANINPNTGLATDYLNHFNEAVMLLDLLPHTPECIVELIGWEPLSYEEHFAASHFKDKELAIAAALRLTEAKGGERRVAHLQGQCLSLP